jgi:succinyl-CoA synthetase alpha subunit
LDKIKALERVGIRVTKNPSKIGEEMLNLMKERRLL